MCLSLVYEGKKKKETLAKLPDMVTCWKLVFRRGNQYGSKYIPEWNYRKGLYLAGWNETIPFFNFKYKIAFHAFCTKKGAKYWEKSWKALNLIKCKTRKKDIVAIGEQGKDSLCLVTKRIWIPKLK